MVEIGDRGHEAYVVHIGEREVELLRAGVEVLAADVLGELDVQLVVVLVEVHRLGNLVGKEHLAVIADGGGFERNGGRLVAHVDVVGCLHDVADTDRRLHIKFFGHHVHDPVQLGIHALRVLVSAQREQHGEHVFRVSVGGNAAEMPGNLADDVFQRIAANEIVGIVRAERVLARYAVDHDYAVIRGEQVDAEFLVYLEVVRDLRRFAVQKPLQNALFGVGIGGDQPLLELVGFRVHLGKRAAELVELVAGAAVCRGLFDVVAVEHLDRLGEARAGAVGNNGADGQNDEAGKQREHGNLRQAAENI